MKTLYSVKVKLINENGKYCFMYFYFRCSGLSALADKLSKLFCNYQIYQVKKLKRIYRKYIKIIEV